MNEYDVELLSAYVDGQLNQPDAAQLESRISSEPQLRTVLDNLRSTRNLLRQLPSRRAPRSFTLTPQMAGIKPPIPRIVPVFRFASAFATFLFIITFLINGLFSFAASAPVPTAFSAAPMSAQGAAPAATQAPALPLPENATQETSAPRLMSASSAPTETPNSLAAGVSPAETSIPENALKSIPPQADNSQLARTQQETSLPLGLEIFFGVLAIGFGVTAWILPRNNERNFRKQMNKKKN